MGTEWGVQCPGSGCATRVQVVHIHGDWAGGYFKPRNWTPAVSPSPGTHGLFSYNVDSFALCNNAPHPESARRFLNAVGSPEGQAAFNRLKGSLPVHKDVSVKGWGESVEQTYRDFQTATHLVNADRFSLPGLSENIGAFCRKEIDADEFVRRIGKSY